MKVLVVQLLLAVSITVMTAEKESRPNIVIFMADDLGMGDVGCFGNETIRTPNIDRIATEGVTFTHSISAASVCTPSRAAMLTGRYPIRMGLVPTNVVRVNMFLASTSGLPSDEITIGEIAQQQGYETALIGKWHLGVHCTNEQDFCHHPNEQGFDYFYGVPLTNLKDFGKDKETVMNSRCKGLDNQLATYAVAGILTVLLFFKSNLLGRCASAGLIAVLAGPVIVFLLMAKNLATINGIVMRNKEVIEQPIQLSGFAKRLAAEGVQYIEQRHLDNKPFLLVIPWLQVHTAMHASEEYEGVSKHGPYGDNVEEMDASVGQILAALDKYGLTNDTFVYFTSDNGGHVEEEGKQGNREGGYNGIYRGGKAQGGMDGGIRVPTVARWPGTIPAGKVMEQPVSLMDVLPTVAGILQTGPPRDRAIDGVDLMPFLREEKMDNKVPHPVLFHYCGDSIHAARYTPADGSGDVWKIHLATPNWEEGTEGCGFICDCYGSSITWHQPPLLYNIGKDPAEKTLLDPLKHVKIVALLQDAILAHHGSLEPVENQYSIMNMLPRPWLQPCCNFPYCKCAEHNQTTKN